MSDVLRLAFSIARSGWQASWNRSFRFSRMKTAAIFLVIQVGFFLLIARRSPVMADPASATQGAGGVMALMALQMAWFGLMYGFARGQQQLYQGILVPLFQISPARPLAFLLGRVIEAVPTRAWSTLLWGIVYSAMLPGPSRWAFALVLALFGLAVGMVAHLSGLLLLTFWGRYSPKTMRTGMLLFGASTLAIFTWAVIYLSGGGTVTGLALAMREYRQTAFAAIAVLAGVPGLLLMMGLAIRPAAVESLYREGVYKVIELGEADVTKPGRSVWLPLGTGVLRAVLSREWLELYRSKVARIQLMVFLAGTVGVGFAGRSVADLPAGHALLAVDGLVLATWFMSFGHWVVRVFEKERRTALLYRLSAVPAGSLLIAKFTSIFVPSAMLVGFGTLVGAIAAERNVWDLGLMLIWSHSALALGIIGGFGAAAATAGEGDAEQQEGGTRGPGDDASAPQATGQAWWSLARTLALLVTAGLPIWLGAGQPGLPWDLPPAPLWGLAVALPLGLLVGGYRLMVRAWEANG